jgi:LPXTG-motif cell wall-anchored protein
MRNHFRISTSTWLTFFGLGFLIGLFIVRRRNRQAARQYMGPVPPIIPPPLPLPRSLPRRGLELSQWHWN